MLRPPLSLVLATASLAVLTACRSDGRSAARSPTSSTVTPVGSQALVPSVHGDATESSDAALIPDAKLATAVEESIARDRMPHSERIHVSVLHGALTLEGTVRTLAAKGRAEKLAGSFKGVTSLTNRIVVDTPSRPDAEIAKDATEAVKSDPATRSASVQATASDRMVTLRGSVDWPTQRDRLQEAVSRVPGVQKVTIAVVLSPRSSRKDAEVEADVRNRLGDDARLDGTRTEVAVRGGSAAISGVVGSLAQRDAATEDAWVEGVAHVDVHALRVDWGENERVRAATGGPVPTDPHISSAVGLALSDDLRVGVHIPTVRVQHGVVTLTGDVMDFRAKNAADRDARRVRGISRVEDRMTVPPASRESDATIQKQVMWGVYNDETVPDVRRVRVMTQNAKVTLQGAVASEEEKKMIESDAEEVPGVVAVENDLQVEGYGPQTHPAAPDSIRHRATEDIFWDPRVGTGKVSVDVAPDGDVTLNGVVDSWGEAQAARDDAISAGAAHVIDRIREADVPASGLGGATGARP